MNVSTRGGAMSYLTKMLIAIATPIALISFNANAFDSNIFVQCPKDVGTELHPGANNPGIKCIHLAAGDGMVSMADDQRKEQYVFSFAELPDPPAGIEINTPEYAGWVMDTGLLAANAPAPTIVIDEGDELFLSLSNVGMAIRPDLFDPHTVHWHGFPEASAIFDGVPDASVSINMAATLTYYYKANDPGTYMYHCHVEAAEHMQMGMLGSLFVRPRQNREPDGTILQRTLTDGSLSESYVHSSTDEYAFNDGDGTTRYDVAYPIQIGSFDPDFHDASFNVQPLPFAGMKDKYFMLNGRGYPDTVNTATLSTPDPLTGELRPSQPVSSLITAAPGQRILLRISNLSVTNIYTLGTSGIKMEVVGLDARILRDGVGNNMYYKTNSLTLGGGQSADVILTAPDAVGTYFLYAKNLDRLANNTENFGGMMTEIRIQ
ncbi:MAG: multicopper oxidase domain-containing protein [Kangiellaceae bacterium]|nr:multicopper oxidase domain-containing protein [Kangiellaceae bacterium]